jgi:hypothetical protein
MVGLTNNDYTVSSIANVTGAIAQTAGTFVYDETSAAEQILVSINVTARAVVGALWLDMTNVTQNTDIAIYHQIDGANYRLVGDICNALEFPYTWMGGENPGVLIRGFTAYRDLRVTLTCGGGGVGNVNVLYAIV